MLFLANVFQRLWLKISFATKKITAGGVTDELEYCSDLFHTSCTSSVDSGVWKKSTFVCDPYANLAKSSCGMIASPPTWQNWKQKTLILNSQFANPNKKGVPQCTWIHSPPSTLNDLLGRDQDKLKIFPRKVPYDYCCWTLSRDSIALQLQQLEAYGRLHRPGANQHPYWEFHTFAPDEDSHRSDPIRSPKIRLWIKLYAHMIYNLLLRTWDNLRMCVQIREVWIKHKVRPALHWESQSWKSLGLSLSIFGLLFCPKLLINARILMSLTILVNAGTLASRVANWLPKLDGFLF
jgi:hypothetical protein